MAGKSWSRHEVEATVRDYFAMLQLELQDQPYNKADHNRTLRRSLADRTKGAVELKHQNISAVLLEMGFVFIPGYKPLGNYQKLLADVVIEQLKSAPELEAIAEREVSRPASPPVVQSMSGVLVDPPKVSRVQEPGMPVPYVRRALKKNYLELEARNRSLGLAGEQFVAEYEARRLHSAGHAALANRVEHVAATKGDGLGYDVLSFELTGRERFIEVKTTAFGATAPFYISRNEVDFSEEQDSQFVLARVHEFRNAPKFFELKGSLRKCLSLAAVTFLARL
jgi:hypothetical protein